MRICRSRKKAAILIVFCIELCTPTKHYPTRLCGSSVLTKRRYISQYVEERMMLEKGRKGEGKQKRKPGNTKRENIDAR